MEAIKTEFAETSPPFGDGFRGAVEFEGDLLVGRAGVVSAAEDDAGTKGEGLRGRMSTQDFAEVNEFIRCQKDASGFPCHEKISNQGKECPGRRNSGGHRHG
jgi:hypothetical protein